MKIKYNLTTNKQDFIQYLIQSTIVEIFNNTNLAYSKEDLHPGFTYSKKLKDKYGNEIEGIVEIIEINDNEFITKITNPTITYIIKYIFDHQTLTYHEDIQSNKKLLEINNKLMSMIFHYKLKNKVLKRLKYMETYIEGKQT